MQSILPDPNGQSAQPVLGVFWRTLRFSGGGPSASDTHWGRNPVVHCKRLVWHFRPPPASDVFWVLVAHGPRIQNAGSPHRPPDTVRHKVGPGHLHGFL